MLIFKFGGASVKDAFSVKHITEILRKYNENIIVVISAMGKTTNALEVVVREYFSGSNEALASLQKVENYHREIMHELFIQKDHPVIFKVNEIFGSLGKKLSIKPSLNYDFEYDQIVSAGELISTQIVAGYLNEAGIQTEWKDIRNSLKTDHTFRDANIDWQLSELRIKADFRFSNSQLLLTQGFIASTIENHSVTLGREGSDYTAAILAYILEAEKVIIWKDVPGVLNADPAYYKDAILLKELSFHDAIELAYYGAKVIHPKTIQPLKQKSIPLYVKSFLNPDADGTKISNISYKKLIPSFIFKTNQTLIHFFSKDFSFIAENNIKVIITCFANNRLKINMMQNSAISFQICVDNETIKIEQIKKDLEDQFEIKLEQGLELVTIKYYDEKTIKSLTEGHEKILEQRNQTTTRIIYRP